MGLMINLSAIKILKWLSWRNEQECSTFLCGPSWL